MRRAGECVTEIANGQQRQRDGEKDGKGYLMKRFLFNRNSSC